MKNIQTIIDKIKKGELEMKPKWHFVLKTIGLVLTGLCVAAAVLFLAGFILFTLRLSGGLYLLKFGLPGLIPFFFSIPWLLFLLLLVLIVVLEAVAHKFSLVYRRPLLYSLLGLVFLTLLGGFLIDKTPMHPSLLMRAEKGQLPVVGQIYRDHGAPKMKDAYRGTITELTSDGFLLQARDGKVFAILITPETVFIPETKDQTEKGAVVVIWGKEEDGKIKALGVKFVDSRGMK